MLTAAAKRTVLRALDAGLIPIGDVPGQRKRRG